MTGPEPSRGPERTCIGCRRVRPAAELVRIGRADDGSLTLGRPPHGRSAWLCGDNPSCREAGLTPRALARAFRGPVGAEEVRRLAARMDADVVASASDFVSGDPAARD